MDWDNACATVSVVPTFLASEPSDPLCLPPTPQSNWSGSRGSRPHLRSVAVPQLRGSQLLRLLQPPPQPGDLLEVRPGEVLRPDPDSKSS